MALITFPNMDFEHAADLFDRLREETRITTVVRVGFTRARIDVSTDGIKVEFVDRSGDPGPALFFEADEMRPLTAALATAAGDYERLDPIREAHARAAQAEWEQMAARAGAAEDEHPR